MFKHHRGKEMHHNYNSFRVFEDVYRDQPFLNYASLDTPFVPQKTKIFYHLFLFLFLLSFVATSLPFFLSYFLKTPYPLVVISDNSLSPALVKNDLMLMRGIVGKKAIKQGDIVVYRAATAVGFENAPLVVRRVLSSDGELLNLSAAGSIVSEIINYKQVVGQAVGGSAPVRFAGLGTLLRVVNLF